MQWVEAGGQVTDPHYILASSPVKWNSNTYRMIGRFQLSIALLVP